MGNESSTHWIVIAAIIAFTGVGLSMLDSFQYQTYSKDCIAKGGVPTIDADRTWRCGHKR